MSFYSYKNTNTDAMPGLIKGDSTKGLCERACVQVHKVYDSCLQQQQINNRDVEVTSLCAICGENDVTPVITPPITFESCRSATSKGILRNLTIDRLCDRPNFARVRGVVDIPIDILFTDANCQEGIGRGVISVEKDVLMYIPDESIVPFCIESLVSAICVSGSYRGDNVFRLTVCVTIILKIVAEVDLLIPTYGYCPVPPCEAFAENVYNVIRYSLINYERPPLIFCSREHKTCRGGARLPKRKPIGNNYSKCYLFSDSSSGRGSRTIFLNSCLHT